MTDQEKKTEEELRQEIIDKHQLDPEDEKDKGIIDDMLQKQKDRFDATNQKKKAQESLDKMTKGKDHYKKIAKTAKPAGEKPPKQEPNGKPLIPTEEVSILFSKRELKNRRELTELKKVMQLTGKTHIEALQDSTFTTWRDNNDKVITSNGSQLPASRGGGNRGEGDPEFRQKLDKAFNPKKKPRS